MISNNIRSNTRQDQDPGTSQHSPTKEVGEPSPGPTSQRTRAAVCCDDNTASPGESDSTTSITTEEAPTTSDQVVESSPAVDKPTPISERTRAAVRQEMKTGSSKEADHTPSSTTEEAPTASDQVDELAPDVDKPTPISNRTRAAARHEAEVLAVSLHHAVDKSPLFSKLPAELRNIAYKYALTAENGVFEITRHGGVPEPALLSTCKIIRREAIGLFYHLNRTDVLVQDYHPAASILLQRKKIVLRKQYGLPYGKAGKHVKGSKNWHNLKLWLKEIHKRHASGRCYLASDDPNRPLSVRREAKHMKGLQDVVIAMREQPWDRVEPILENLHVGLVALDSQWV